VILKLAQLAAALFVARKLTKLERVVMAISAATQALIDRIKTTTDRWVVTLREARETIATLRAQVAAGGLPATEEGKSAADEAADDAALDAVISEAEAAGTDPQNPLPDPVTPPV